MQNRKAIEQLGYTKKEALLYLASLSAGEARVSTLSEQLNMPRSSVQFMLERLRKDGLMNFYVMRSHRYWYAEDPRCLLEKIKEREVVVERAIPKLVAVRKRSTSRILAGKKMDIIAPLRLFADGVSHPVLIAGEHGDIWYVNDAWERVFGYQKFSILGKHTRILRTTETPPSEHNRLWDSMRQGVLFTSNAFVEKRHDGSTFHCHVVAFPALCGNRKFWVQIVQIKEGGQTESFSK